MTDFQIRSDNVDVEGIMRQIRARIREKRGVDYTEEEIRELARVKLEKFLDPTGVRSDLLQQFRRTKSEQASPRNYGFEDSTIYETHRGVVRWLRKILNPILKLFFNPAPIAEALHLQSKINDYHARREEIYYELIHNLVLETTRLGIEVKNLRMRVESISSRLDFDERRARALEGVVQYRPGAAAPLQPPVGSATEAAQQERRTRRRRRRGRKPGSSREGAAEGRGEDAAVEPARDRRERGPRGPRETGDREPSPSASEPAAVRDGGNEHATVETERSHEPAAESRPESVRTAVESQSFAPRQERVGEAEPVPPKPHHERSGEGGPVPPKPHDERSGEGGLVPPKPHDERSGEGGPVPPKPHDERSGEGG